MLLKAGANPSSVNEMVILTCTLTCMYSTSLAGKYIGRLFYSNNYVHL